jgi:hypothetical protein
MDIIIIILLTYFIYLLNKMLKINQSELQIRQKEFGIKQIERKNKLMKAYFPHIVLDNKDDDLLERIQGLFDSFRYRSPDYVGEFERIKEQINLEKNENKKTIMEKRFAEIQDIILEIEDKLIKKGNLTPDEANFCLWHYFDGHFDKIKNICLLLTQEEFKQSTFISEINLSLTFFASSWFPSCLSSLDFSSFDSLRTGGR